MTTDQPADLDRLRRAHAHYDQTGRDHDAHELAAELPALIGEVERLRGALTATRDQATDPRLLRWCGWLGCLAAFDATKGPTDRGWERRNRPMVLLCPTHATAGHTPGFDIDPGDLTGLDAHCQCGAAERVHPSNHDAVAAWWAGHLATTAA